MTRPGHPRMRAPASPRVRMRPPLRVSAPTVPLLSVRRPLTARTAAGKFGVGREVQEGEEFGPATDLHTTITPTAPSPWTGSSVVAEPSTQPPGSETTRAAATASASVAGTDSAPEWVPRRRAPVPVSLKPSGTVAAPARPRHPLGRERRPSEARFGTRPRRPIKNPASGAVWRVRRSRSGSGESWVRDAQPRALSGSSHPAYQYRAHSCRRRLRCTHSCHLPSYLGTGPRRRRRFANASHRPDSSPFATRFSRRHGDWWPRRFLHGTLTRQGRHGRNGSRVGGRPNSRSPYFGTRRSTRGSRLKSLISRSSTLRRSRE